MSQGTPTRRAGDVDADGIRDLLIAAESGGWTVLSARDGEELLRIVADE